MSEEGSNRGSRFVLFYFFEENLILPASAVHSHLSFLFAKILPSIFLRSAFLQNCFLYWNRWNGDVTPTLARALLCALRGLTNTFNCQFKPLPPSPPMHHAMHPTMHGPACPSGNTPIRPLLTSRHQLHTILLLRFGNIYPECLTNAAWDYIWEQ